MEMTLNIFIDEEELIDDFPFSPEELEIDHSFELNVICEEAAKQRIRNTLRLAKKAPKRKKAVVEQEVEFIKVVAPRASKSAKKEVEQEVECVNDVPVAEIE